MTAPKVAICFSGISKKSMNVIDHFFNNLIRPNNADVFIHTWDNHPRISELINRLNPKKHVVESMKSFHNSNMKMSEELRLRFYAHYDSAIVRELMVNNAYAMWYGIHQAILCKELYALEKDIKYDFVFRVRFDVCPNSIIKASNYTKEILYYLDLNQPYDMISDWFNFGDNNIMNIYSNVFFNIENAYNYLIDTLGLWSNELFLKYHMDMHKIKRQKILSDNVFWGSIT